MDREKSIIQRIISKPEEWAWRGVITFAIVFGLFMSFGAEKTGINPVGSVYNVVSESVSSGPCNRGDYYKTDEHAKAFTCIYTYEGKEIQVVFGPDGSFNHATILGEGHIFVEGEVPGW